MERRVFKLLWVFPSFAIGPTQRRFAALAGALGRDYAHTICALDGDFSAAELIGDAVSWRRMDAPKQSRGLFSLGRMWAMRRALNAEQPDVLVTVNWGGVEWLMVNRGPGAAPHLHLEDTLEAGDTPAAPDAKKAWTRRRAFTGRNRAYVATSRAVERLFKSAWSAPHEAVHYIPTGVDAARFAAPARNASGRVIRIAALGPLSKDAGVDRALRVTAELRRRGRNVGLVVVGDGPERATLEAEAGRLGVEDKVDFVGAQKNIAPFLAQFDMLAVTNETALTPPGLLEGMASGLPVVGLAAGDLRETVDKANQLFIRPLGDESGLVAAAELLASDPEARNKIGAANQARAASAFSETAMVARYDRVLRDLAQISRPLMLPAPGRVAPAQTA